MLSKEISNCVIVHETRGVQIQSKTNLIKITTSERIKLFSSQINSNSQLLEFETESSYEHEVRKICLYICISYSAMTSLDGIDTRSTVEHNDISGTASPTI